MRRQPCQADWRVALNSDGGNSIEAAIYFVQASLRFQIHSRCPGSAHADALKISARMLR